MKLITTAFWLCRGIHISSIVAICHCCASSHVILVSSLYWFWAKKLSIVAGCICSISEQQWLPFHTWVWKILLHSWRWFLLSPSVSYCLITVLLSVNGGKLLSFWWNVLLSPLVKKNNGQVHLPMNKPLTVIGDCYYRFWGRQSQTRCAHPYTAQAGVCAMESTQPCRGTALNIMKRE